MNLSTGAGVDVAEPTPDQVVEAIRSLPGGMDSFVILSIAEHQFLQAAGSREEGFRLEYKDAEHFVAKDDTITEEDLTQAFLSYLRGDDFWKQQNEWIGLEGSGSRGCTGAAASILLIASLLLVLAHSV